MIIIIKWVIKFCMLIAQNIEYHIQETLILNHVSTQFQPGLVYGIVGHNGSGKSTFTKLLAKQIIATSGSITLNQKNLTDYSHKQLARKLSYLPQYLPTDINLPVKELVKLGRFAWHGVIGRYTDDDSTIINQALAQTHTAHLKDRYLSSLSGGERQRVWLSMCLAQQSQYLLLDEPLSALDINYQIEVMRLLKQLAKDYDITTIIVLHDINLASEFCDHLLAFKHGQLIYDLATEQMMTPTILQQIYGIHFDVITHPSRGHKVALA